MLALKANPTFSSPVQLSIPGRTEKAEISVTWRHKTRKEFDAWLAKPGQVRAAAEAALAAHQAWLKEPAGPAPVIPGLSDAEYMHEVIADWSGPVNDEGQPVPYSLQALERLMDEYHAASGEMFEAYCQELQGARAKNSVA